MSVPPTLAFPLSGIFTAYRVYAFSFVLSEIDSGSADHMNFKSDGNKAKTSFLLIKTSTAALFSEVT